MLQGGNMVRDLIYQLQIIVNTEGVDETNSTIARVILENMDKDMENISIMELADLCYTSISTISRFVKKLGYASFNEFKLKCIEKRRLDSEILVDNEFNLRFGSRDDKGQVIGLAQSIGESLINFADKVNLEEVDQLIRMIHETKEINLFGFHLSGYFIQNLQYHLFLAGKFASYACLEGDQEKLAEMSATDSLSIIFSVDGNFLRIKSEIFFTLKKNGGKIVLVTQNPALKMAGQWDYVYYLGDYKGATEGRYKLQLYTEILINRYCQKYGQIKK